MIGNRLKEQRKNIKMRQRELAQLIGVQVSMISRYETDRDDPSDKIKIEIARVLSISLDYLLGVIDEPIPYYSPDKFIILPKKLNPNDEVLLSEFVTFLYDRDNNAKMHNE